MMDVMKQKISFCIELKDAFTNKSIEAEDICVRVNGKLPVIQKEKRYYIFQEIQSDTIEVDITSTIYENRHCVMQITGYCKKDSFVYVQAGSIRNFFGIPMISIVLYPNQRYSLPTGYERREYKGKPWEEVRVIKDKKNVFLLADRLLWRRDDSDIHVRETKSRGDVLTH